jgi:hypothetical protein
MVQNIFLFFFVFSCFSEAFCNIHSQPSEIKEDFKEFENFLTLKGIKLFYFF